MVECFLFLSCIACATYYLYRIKLDQRRSRIYLQKNFFFPFFNNKSWLIFFGRTGGGVLLNLKLQYFLFSLPCIEKNAQFFFMSFKILIYIYIYLFFVIVHLIRRLNWIKQGIVDDVTNSIFKVLSPKGEEKRSLR